MKKLIFKLICFWAEKNGFSVIAKNKECLLNGDDQIIPAKVIDEWLNGTMKGEM